MKKLLVLTLVAAMAFFGTNAFATDDCNGGPECSAQGNFSINTFAAGGGLDLHGVLLTKGYPVSGAAGGVSAAGGIGFGNADGGFKSFRFWGKTITLGSAGAELYSAGGGQVLVDQAYTMNKHQVEDMFDPSADFDKAIGVGSQSHAVAVTAGNIKVNAKGLALSYGTIGGAAGQVTADGSFVLDSPKHFQSKGISFGVAAQGSLGGFLGGAATFGYGDADVGADITMNGWTISESYRAISGDTEIMGTNVLTQTMVDSNVHNDANYLAVGYIEGGWVAGGVAASGTVQATDYGIAKAGAIGTYKASGELGCDFNGSAVGYTQTSATQTSGYRGSIMTSSAGMQVTSGKLPSPQPE